MTTAIHLCGPDDADRLLPLMAQFHAEMDHDLTDAQRRAAVAPLLAGTPLGAAWLFGPRQAPTGYVVVSFGWSIEFGGMDATLDEFYIRPPVRRRGIGFEVLVAVANALRGAGVRAISLELDRDNPANRRLYEKAGFRARDSYCLMTRLF